MPDRPPPVCPKCRTSQLSEKLLSDEKTHVDVCPRCLGGWFDGQELATVLSCALDELDIPHEAERTSCVCPRCFVPLARMDYPDTHVEIDACERCSGIWLDRGEFRAINRQRAEFQDRMKFYEEQPRPQSLRQAVVQFVDRMAARYSDIV